MNMENGYNAAKSGG